MSKKLKCRYVYKVFNINQINTFKHINQKLKYMYMYKKF